MSFTGAGAAGGDDAADDAAGDDAADDAADDAGGGAHIRVAATARVGRRPDVDCEERERETGREVTKAIVGGGAGPGDEKADGLRMGRKGGGDGGAGVTFRVGRR